MNSIEMPLTNGDTDTAVELLHEAVVLAQPWLLIRILADPGKRLK